MVEHAIVVIAKTRLEQLQTRFNTKAQAKFYVERQGVSFKQYEDEHEQIQDTYHTVLNKLNGIIKYKTIDRAFVSSYIFSANDLVITIGQDGLVANTAKYARGIPIVAVNPDVNLFDGVLLPFNFNNFHLAVEKVLHQKFSFKETHFAEAVLNDGQKLFAFNDFFIGAATHVSARYKITYGSQSEDQSSSGIIISTKAGSTGWLSSVVNMTYGLYNFFDHTAPGKKAPVIHDDELLFIVREPFLSKTSKIGITAGKIQNNNKLVIESNMPSAGIIFSDGIESDFIKFTTGFIATISSSKEKAILVQKDF